MRPMPVAPYPPGNGASLPAGRRVRGWTCPGIGYQTGTPWMCELAAGMPEAITKELLPHVWRKRWERMTPFLLGGWQELAA